jgi:hypothetical protein
MTKNDLSKLVALAITVHLSLSIFVDATYSVSAPFPDELSCPALIA